MTMETTIECGATVIEVAFDEVVLEGPGGRRIEVPASLEQARAFGRVLLVRGAVRLTLTIAAAGDGG